MLLDSYVAWLGKHLVCVHVPYSVYILRVYIKFAESAIRKIFADLIVAFLQYACM